MKIAKRIRRMLLALFVATATGCASAYHDYQDEHCCVPYDYCQPPPLPYALYSACLTPWAECYLDKTSGVPPADAQAEPLPVGSLPEADTAP